MSVESGIPLLAWKVTLEYECLSLGAHSQGHRCKKGNEEGAECIVDRRMYAYALAWQQPLASAVKPRRRGSPGAASPALLALIGQTQIAQPVVSNIARASAIGCMPSSTWPTCPYASVSWARYPAMPAAVPATGMAARPCRIPVLPSSPW